MFDSRPGLFRRLLLTGLAIAGAIALIIGIVTALGGKPQSQDGFFAAIAAIFSRQETISVRAEPSEISSGGVFRFSWDHQTKRRGSYRLLTSCPAGVEVRQVHRDIKLCNTDLPLTPDLALLLSATNRNPDPAELKLFVVFEEGSARANTFFGGFTVVQVRPASPPISATPPSSAGPPPPVIGRPVPRPSEPPRFPPPPPREPPPGPRLPDLAVRIIDVGTTTPDAKQFFPATSIRRSDITAVLFDVSNIGGTSSPEWQFEAFLPIETSTFNSGLQPPISAGGAVRFILGFSGLSNPGASGPGGSFRVTVNVDPKNEIKEGNESNNSAVTTLPVAFD